MLVAAVVSAVSGLLYGYDTGWWRMPELTGHSLEDIEKRLQDGNFRPADFAKS